MPRFKRSNAALEEGSDELATCAFGGSRTPLSWSGTPDVDTPTSSAWFGKVTADTFCILLSGVSVSGTRVNGGSLVGSLGPSTSIMSGLLWFVFVLLSAADVLPGTELELDEALSPTNLVMKEGAARFTPNSSSSEILDRKVERLFASKCVSMRLEPNSSARDSFTPCGGENGRSV